VVPPRPGQLHGPPAAVVRCSDDVGRMPRLSSFYGIVIYMYIRDHGVAHVHALHGDDRAVVEVATGAILAGTLKPRQASMVREWVELHRAELVEAWRRASAGESPGTIDPLP